MNIEEISQLSMGSITHRMKTSYFVYLFYGESGILAFYATWSFVRRQFIKIFDVVGAAFASSVFSIIEIRAFKQVCWIATRRIVTFVTNQLVRFSFIIESKCYTVCSARVWFFFSTVNSLGMKKSIAKFVSRTQPRPAIVWSIDLYSFPKCLNFVLAHLADRFRLLSRHVDHLSWSMYRGQVRRRKLLICLSL